MGQASSRLTEEGDNRAGKHDRSNYSNFYQPGGIPEFCRGVRFNEVGVNLLDTKDYYVLGRGRHVVTGRVDVPIANGNHLTLEVNKALSETGRDSLWVTYRLDMAKLWEW